MECYINNSAVAHGPAGVSSGRIQEEVFDRSQRNFREEEYSVCVACIFALISIFIMDTLLVVFFMNKFGG